MKILKSNTKITVVVKKFPLRHLRHDVSARVTRELAKSIESDTRPIIF